MQFSVLDFLFPRRSLSREEGAWVTPAERLRMAPDVAVVPEPELRARGVEHLDTLVSAVAYDSSPLVRRAVWSFKYGRARHAEQELVRLLLAVARRRRRSRAGLTFCPVPLHWSRRFDRGFNQASVLSHALALECALPHAELLLRRRATGHQAHRERAARLTALRDAFSVRRGVSVPRHVVLIDDIATTGATLDACACVLKEAGASWVEGWVVARG